MTPKKESYGDILSDITTALMMNQPPASSSAKMLATASQPSPLHVRLSDPTWAIWRQSALRGAGFPVDMPLQLAAPACVVSAEHLLQRERALQATKDALVDMLVTLSHNDAMTASTYAGIIQRLHAGKMPKLVGLPPDIQVAIAELVQRRTEVDEARTAYQAQFTASLDASTAIVRILVDTEQFRQALAWQNRQALHTCLAPFLSKSGAQQNNHFRQHRTVLVKYLQRYAMKNDTIGFFGPVGWARWQPESPTTTLQPGPHLLARRTVYIDGWCINALSQALLAANSPLLLWAKPRLMPTMRVEQGVLHLPFVKPLPLPLAQARVLAACTGMHSAQTIAHYLSHQGIPGITQATDVYAILAKMQQMRRIIWSFDVSLEDPYPERSLRRNFDEIGDPDLRASVLAALTTLDQAADSVRQAANAVQIEASIEHFEATFTQLTAQTSTRSAGELYAARTLIYEDCERDLSLTLGADVFQPLELPLTLLLTSARWLAYHLAQTCRHYFLAAYKELAQKNPTAVVEFSEYFSWVNAQLYENLQPFIREVQSQFQEKWAAILAIAVDQHHGDYAAADLVAQVNAAFDAPGRGWSSARHHSPDIMIAAPNIDAIHRGEFQYVMGELHLGMNTLNNLLFTLQNPEVAEMYTAIGEDIPEPQVFPITASQFLPATRIQQALALAKDFRLAVATDSYDPSTGQTLRVGDLVVRTQDGTTQVCTRDGQLQFDVLAVFSDYFSMVVADCFAIFPSGPHTPRVTIDRLVVTREAWRMHADDVPFITVQDQAECYVEVRRWAKMLGMPRFLFYRTPKEKKPCYLDLDSPLYVDLFVKEVRRMVKSEATEGFVVSLSEMLPTPDNTWLVDAQGNHYTSEIRIVAVDTK